MGFRLSFPSRNEKTYENIIIANNPKNIGGVMNYTRPIASCFVEMEHEVHYLYSGTWDYLYNLLMLPYLRRVDTDFNFSCAEIVNSTNFRIIMVFPNWDVRSAAIEKIVNKCLDRIKPDVVHIHSRVGFPAIINKLAHDRQIVVCNTIHTYGYICQKRVMIDYQGETCEGPTDF